ncbi:MAG: hypothetical protein MMC23_004088 [Stictis urceolatum]|nr:hypothetical protein [Stictis urceolata]
MISLPSPPPPRHHQPVAIVLGASRGIGRQIALTLSSANYAVVLSSKSTSAPLPLDTPPPDPNSSASTITTVAAEVVSLGGTALAIPSDTRSPASIDALFARSWARFGRLDALVYNPGAIWWASVQNTPQKRFELMQAVNATGLYASVQASLPYFSAHDWAGGRIVVVSPPIYSRFFRGKAAYAMTKVSMSVLTKGLAMDWEREGKVGRGMAVASLWPAASIESAATQGSTRAEPELRRDLRRPEIFADAVLAVLRADAGRVNGMLDTDEDFLRREEGISDFGKYAIVPGATPRRIMPNVFPTLEVEEQADEGRRVDSAKLRGLESKL